MGGWSESDTLDGEARLLAQSRIARLLRTRRRKRQRVSRHPSGRVVRRNDAARREYRRTWMQRWRMTMAGKDWRDAYEARPEVADRRAHLRRARAIARRTRHDGLICR